MNTNTIFIIILLAVVFMVSVYFFVKKILLGQIKALANDALVQNNEHFLSIAKDFLLQERDSLKSEMKTDLQGKKDSINSLVDEIRKDLKNSETRLRESDDQRVKIFSELTNELKTYKELTGKLQTSTDELKNVLSNNQLRGSFGEQVADNLLKMSGFVVDVDYTKNKKQETNQNRPDFTVYMPDRTKINIDAKFPYSNLLCYAEADKKSDKDKYLALFKLDVKQKIKQVTSRDYINPEEKTVDFVVMFIPNEMIFSIIYDKMSDVWEEAMAKKVILVGPFSFVAILRMVKQAYTNFKYQENLQQIIGLIQKFDMEYQNYSEAVDTLGSRLDSTVKQFDVVSKTRDKALGTVISKIRSHNIIEEPLEIISLDKPSQEE